MASILFTARDDASRGINSVRSATKYLSQDTRELGLKMQELTQKQERAYKALSSAQSDLDKAKSVLRAATKAHSDFNDEVSRLKLDAAHDQYNRAADEVSRLKKETKEATRAIAELGDEQRRQDNRSSGGSIRTAVSDVTKKQVGLEAAKMAGVVAQQIGQAWVSSSYGDEAGTMFSAGLSSAISGAALGNMLLPGVGTAIGAVLGGGLGLVSGSIQNFERRDDAFKSYVQEATEGQLEAISNGISSGSTIAAGRESDLRALTSLLGGSESRAASFQQALIEAGRTPPFSYNTAMSLSRDMLGLGLSTDETMSRIGNLSNAAAALNLSESSVSSIVSYLESAQLSGKLEGRVVKSLSKMGINAYEAIAKEFNIGVDEVADKLGDLDVERGISAIYKYMGDKFAGAAEGLTNTYAGASGVLESYQNDMDNAYGEGYNEARNVGIKDQIDFMGGESGEEMQEVNRAMGAWKASLENDAERIEREAIQSVLTGITTDSFKPDQNRQLLELYSKYSDAKKEYEAGDEESYAQMGYALAEAKVIAQNAYNASDGAQLLQKSERDLANEIRLDSATNQDYWDAGYAKGEQYTKGMAAAIRTTGIGTFRAASSYLTGVAPSPASSYAAAAQNAGSHAAGLNRVPYDGYRAILHEGERVLTAAETRQADRGGNKPTINLTVNVDGAGSSNPKELAATVAQVIVRELTLAKQLYSG